MSMRNFEKSISLEGAKCSIVDRFLKFEGKHGSIVSPEIPDFLEIELSDGQVGFKINPTVKKIGMEKHQRALSGTIKSTIKSMITGVNECHSICVVLSGTGSGAESKGKNLTLKVGKSHPVILEIFDGITCTIPSSDIKSTKILISGVNLCKVKHFAKMICDLSKNRYKGGIHIYFEGNPPVLKEGKK